MKELIKKLDTEIASGNRMQANSSLAQGLGQDAEKFVQTIRKLGVFRTSRYDYESEMVRDLAENILTSHGGSLQTESRDYIRI
jgi:hypothetical protein